MASASPGYVRLRSFHRFGPGDVMCASDRAVDPSNVLVGTSGGRFFVQKQVRFFVLSPNCHGWTVKFGLRFMCSRAYLCITGFSTATCGALAARHALKKSHAACTSSHRLRSCSHLTPELHSLVQGGWAITRVHCCCSRSITSPWMCGPGVSLGSRSQLMALCPWRINASRTRPEYSQAISICGRVMIVSTSGCRRPAPSRACRKRSAARCPIARR